MGRGSWDLDVPLSSWPERELAALLHAIDAPAALSELDELVAARDRDVAALVALAFALAASANLPTILYTLFWRRFNTTGTLWSIYGGLGSCLLLIIFSPVFSGARTSIFPDIDFHLFPLSNPGLVSIPLSFILGFVGTLVGRDRPDPARTNELEVRSIIGA